MKEFEHYSDAELVEKISGGETRLYELLIRRYNPFLYRIGRSHNYTHHDTEDLMQETYINAFFGLRGFERRSTFKTWITRIMLNNCYHKKQRASFRNEIPSESPLIDRNPPIYHSTTMTEKNIVNKELGHIVEHTLARLPEDYRLVFTLRELNGLNVAETAAVTDISEANVKVRLNRAKAMLRREIEKVYTPSEIYEFNLVYCTAMVERVMKRIGG